VKFDKEMGVPFKLRLYTARDMTGILRLEERFPPKNRTKLTTAEVHRLTKASPDTCWVAEDEGKIVGFVFGEVRHGCFFIRSAQVDIDRIGEGIIHQLLEKIIARTKCKAIAKS
jgi:N-acetylglutamate synthase-like GNAT family acetyltransferase